MFPLDHFGLAAPFYERVIQFKNREQMISIARLPIEGALLDAGGGTGRVAQHLRGQAGKIVVADVSMGMLRQAAKKDGLCLACAHTESLPFPDSFFERILMIDAFHHVYDQPRTAWELWRILRPGGLLVIEEPDIRNIGVKFVAIFEKLAFMRSHFMNPGRIASLFAFPGAHREIYRQSYNAWICIEKQG